MAASIPPAAPSALFDLTGHVGLVTGGNGGIGLGMAKGLKAAGADVAIWGTNPDKNAAATAELEAIGTGKVLALRCDVGDEEQVDAAFAQTVDALGKVDSCFANAGVGAGAPFRHLTLDTWRAVQRVNSEGAFLTLRAATRHMIDRGEGGRLICVSSTSQTHGAARNASYAHSRAGMSSMIRGLAVELARYGITANAIVPGWIETDMTPGAFAVPDRRMDRSVAIGATCASGTECLIYERRRGTPPPSEPLRCAARRAGPASPQSGRRGGTRSTDHPDRRGGGHGHRAVGAPRWLQLWMPRRQWRWPDSGRASIGQRQRSARLRRSCSAGDCRTQL